MKMMRWKGGKDWESALHTERKNPGGWSMKGALFTLAGLAQNPAGRRGAEQRQLRNRDAMRAPSQLCRPFWKDRATQGGPAASVEAWRRPGQLACPEDT